jgi:hypothetical protein
MVRIEHFADLRCPESRDEKSPLLYFAADRHAIPYPIRIIVDTVRKFKYSMGTEFGVSWRFINPACGPDESSRIKGLATVSG